MRNSLFLGFATLAFAGALSAQTYDAVTDQKIRPLPPAPKMGPAGTIVNDPTYGNPIVRITDLNTVPGSGEGCVTPATAMLNNWNTDNTRFFVYCRGMSIVPFDFDPASMKATRSHGGIVLHMVSPSFSFNDRNLVYGPGNGGGLSDSVIYAYNFANNQYTPVFDLNQATRFTGGTGATSISANDYFTVDFNGIQDRRSKLIWLNLKTKQYKLLDTQAGTVNGRPVSFDGQSAGFGIHLVNMDKSGRFVVISKGDNSIAPNLLVWDTSNDTFTHVRQYGTGHYSIGWGKLLNGNGLYPYYMQWMLRPLDNVNNILQLVRPNVTAGAYGDKEEHTSWNNARADIHVPAFTALTRDSWSNNPPGPWDDEIIGIGTDPNQSVVYRFGHTFALFDNSDFWDLPRGNVSQDGRFYMFTSNWRKTLDSARDVFIIKLPLKGGTTNPAPGDSNPTDPGQTDPGQTDPGQTDPGQTDPTVSSPAVVLTSILSLSSSANPAEAGRQVTFTVNLKPQCASGAVAFKDGETVLARVNVSGGVATFSTSALAGGTHQITAEFTGEGDFAGSHAAATFAQSVQGPATPPATQVPVSSGPNLVQNEGFENGTTGWNGSGAADTAVRFTGNASVRVSSGASVTQRVRAYAGVPYMLTAWVRTGGAAGAVSIVWRNSAGAELRRDHLQVVPANKDWTPVNAWVWAPYNAYSAEVVLGAAAGNSGSVWFDETRFGVK